MLARYSFFGKLFMVGNILLDKMVKRFDINRFEVPCVQHTFKWSNVAPRLDNHEPANNSVSISSCSISYLKKIGLEHSKDALLANPSMRPSSVESHNVSCCSSSLPSDSSKIPELNK